MSAGRSTAMQWAKVATESIRKVEGSRRVGRACSVFPLVISAPEEIRTPNLLIRRHLRWLGVGIGIDLLGRPYTHTRLHRDSSSGIGQATMVVGNADDHPPMSVISARRPRPATAWRSRAGPIATASSASRHPNTKGRRASGLTTRGRRPSSCGCATCEAGIPCAGPRGAHGSRATYWQT